MAQRQLRISRAPVLLGEHEPPLIRLPPPRCAMAAYPSCMLCVHVKRAYLSFSEDVVRDRPEKRGFNEKFVEGIHIAASTELSTANSVARSQKPQGRSRSLLVFECWQSLQHFSCPWPIEYQIVFADFT